MEARVLALELKRRHDWTLHRAFSSIDVSRDGHLTFSSLLNFFRINGYNPIETEVVAVIRRLDCDANQRITFEEFRMLFGEDESPANSYIVSSPREALSPKSSAIKGTSPMRRKQSSPKRVAFEETKSSQPIPSFKPRSPVLSPRANPARDSSRNSPLRSKSP